MTWLSICSYKIDWSATGTWFTGFVTSSGVFFAYRALRTWKDQIHLQDRYQKADALLLSFILCIQAGHEWQWDYKIEGSFIDNVNSEKSRLWRNALIEYRTAWALAHVLYEGKENERLSIHPDTIQSNIISAGSHLRETADSLEYFSKLEQLREDGLNEIIDLRKRSSHHE